MSAPFSPAPWVVAPDPMEEQEYKVLVEIPGHTGCGGTWLARCEHNWNDADAGERRISWAEAEANARLIAAAPDLYGDAQFLVDRLGEFESELSNDEAARQFFGHVAPAIARLCAALAKADGATP